MFNLGTAFANLGDLDQAINWYTKAAEAGHGQAAGLAARARSERAERFAQSHASNAGSSGGWCYIATAIYGSYDAAPVLTLRRFRDQDLVRSAVGRASVRIYYAISPTLAHHFQRIRPLNTLGKLLLDHLVERLDRREAADEN